MSAFPAVRGSRAWGAAERAGHRKSELLLLPAAGSLPVPSLSCPDPFPIWGRSLECPWTSVSLSVKWVEVGVDGKEVDSDWGGSPGYDAEVGVSAV